MSSDVSDKDIMDFMSSNELAPIDRFNYVKDRISTKDMEWRAKLKKFR